MKRCLTRHDEQKIRQFAENIVENSLTIGDKVVVVSECPIRHRSDKNKRGRLVLAQPPYHYGTMTGIYSLGFPNRQAGAFVIWGEQTDKWELIPLTELVVEMPVPKMGENE